MNYSLTTQILPSATWQCSTELFQNLNSSMHRYVLHAFIHIPESSHICPGQESFMSTQPPPTSSPLGSLFFSCRPKNRNQSRKRWLCFQPKSVCVKIWVGKERGREMRKKNLRSGITHVTTEWLLKMAFTCLVSKQWGHGLWQFSHCSCV